MSPPKRKDCRNHVRVILASMAIAQNRLILERLAKAGIDNEGYAIHWLQLITSIRHGIYHA
jgi:hypothetical protein